MVYKKAHLLLLSLWVGGVTSFAPQPLGRPLNSKTQLLASMDRRHLLGAASALLLSWPNRATADTGAEVRGTPVNAFNGLAFQYRGNDFGGLRAQDIDEPSISYAEFCAKLQAKEVKFVEFMAPSGDKAYAELSDGRKIRIGEGYPIEDARGYSSPTFAIRAVQNAQVPYKFIVPAVAQINK